MAQEGVLDQAEINRRNAYHDTQLRYDSRAEKNFDFMAWLDSKDSSARQVPGARADPMERWEALAALNPNPNTEKYKEYFLKDNWTYTENNKTYENVMQAARPGITTAYYDVSVRSRDTSGALRRSGGSRLTKHRRKLSKRKRKRKRKPSKRRRRKSSKRRR